jgi:hypothetical protein
MTTLMSPNNYRRVKLHAHQSVSVESDIISTIMREYCCWAGQSAKLNGESGDGAPLRSQSSTALLWRTTRLVSGDLGSNDPFIGLADMATILGAVIFDDRVVVLGDEEIVDIAARANALLGLDDVIRPISFNPDPDGEQPSDRTFSALIESLFLSAQAELVRASSEGADWLERLRQSWAELLPGVREFPAYHDAGFYEVIDKYKDQPYDLYDLFNIAGGEWKFSFEQLDELILDNDLRGLYYERVVQCFTAMLTEGRTGPSVHYASGGLRSPMLLARAKYAATPFRESTTTIGRLQQSWKALESANALAAASAEPFVLPFWGDAALAGCRRPEDLPRVVSRYRSKARGFRRRRGELDRAIHEGDTERLDLRVLALRGDASKLSLGVTSSVGVAVGVVSEVASALFVPTPLPGIGTGSGFLAERLARIVPAYLFRPHLHGLMSLGKDARSRDGSLARAADLFELPSARHKAERVLGGARTGRLDRLRTRTSIGAASSRS